MHTRVHPKQAPAPHETSITSATDTRATGKTLDPRVRQSETVEMTSRRRLAAYLRQLTAQSGIAHGDD